MRLTTLVLLTCAAAFLAPADTLTLRSGEVVHGTFLGATSRQVRLEVQGAVQTFDVSDIRALEFVDATPVPPPAPARVTRQDGPPPPPSFNPGPGSRSQASSQGVTLPVDTLITVRMIDTVNSEKTRLGQLFMASLDEPIVVNGNVVLPRGADVTTKLVEDSSAGKLKGRSVLTLALVSINVNGRTVELTSADVRTESASQGAKTAKTVGGTAALGAIIGGIVGGGKGAAIGAGSGAAVGTVAAVATSGEKVVIPSETRLTFRLQSPAQL